MFYRAFTRFVLGTILGLFVLSLVTARCSAQDETPPIRLEGMIGMSQPGYKLLYLQDIQAAIKARVDAGAQRINIIIDSPGGVVDAQAKNLLAYLNELREAHIIVSCHVDNLAASLAMSVFSYCGERSASPKAKLIWHSMRAITPAGIVITQYDAEELATHLKAGNEILFRRLFELSGNRDLIELMAKHEVVWPPKVLASIIPGLLTVTEE